MQNHGDIVVRILPPDESDNHQFLGVKRSYRSAKYNANRATGTSYQSAERTHSRFAVVDTNENGIEINS